MDTTRDETLEVRLENLVRNGVLRFEGWILFFIRSILFALTLPRRALPALLHVAAFTTVLPSLLAISAGAGTIVVKLIPVGWEAELWMQYGEQANPFARAPLPSLVPGQAYDISLKLDIPVSTGNMDLGNFMTKLIIVDPKNLTVASANRPSLILGKRSLGWLPFISSSNSNIETIEIPLLHDWSPLLVSGILTNPGLGIARGITQKDFYAFVTIGRPDAWKSLGAGEGREVSIVRAALHGKVKLFGVRGYFARHTYVLFSITTAIFFCTSVLAALVLYLLFSPAFSGPGDVGDASTSKIGDDRYTAPRPSVKIEPEETEPPSSETESWTSGGPDIRVRLESEDDGSEST